MNFFKNLDFLRLVIAVKSCKSGVFRGVLWNFMSKLACLNSCCDICEGSFVLYKKGSMQLYATCRNFRYKIELRHKNVILNLFFYKLFKQLSENFPRCKCRVESNEQICISHMFFCVFKITASKILIWVNYWNYKIEEKIVSNALNSLNHIQQIFFSKYSLNGNSKSLISRSR